MYTKELEITENTLTIHHFDGSWVSEEQKYAQALSSRMKIIPKQIRGYVANFIAICRFRGIIEAITYTIKWFRK